MSEHILFDPDNQLLIIADERAHLSPKAFAVLACLFEHKQQLVSKDDLLSAVWPRVFVTDAVLKVAIGELRKVLDDHPKKPRFIETVHRRGYRFIGEMQLPGAIQANAPSPIPQTTLPQQQAPTLHGRDAEWQQLDLAWGNTQQSRKQIVFVCAEAGMGKTALINHWLDQHFTEPDNALLARVNCFDQHGSSEPYLPILNAFSQLLNTPQQESIKPLLRQYAPSWYLQIPALFQADEEAQLKQEAFGATSQRMLREFADFIEALSRTSPLLLCIEDLHWCDTASIDLLQALAMRQSIGRFMLLGSLRSSELERDNTTLKTVYSQLLLQQQCQSLTLAPLKESAVLEFLHQHLPKALQQPQYTELFQRYTEGNPLLLNAALEHLQQSGQLATLPTETSNEHEESALNPEQLEQLICGGLKHILNLRVAQLARGERQIMEAASVSASDFATESIAAVLQQDVLAIEEVCEETLLHEQWLAPVGSQNWPDGSISECYRFWHQLYRLYFYEGLSGARRRHYHLRFAERLLSGFPDKSDELAAQLAYHFEAGGNLQQAIHFALQASTQAAQCFAYIEAITHTNKVLELAQRLGDIPMQLQARKQRCQFLLASGQLPDTIAEYRQLITESQQAQTPRQEVNATLGLADALFWVDRQACLDTAQHAVALSQQLDDANLQIHASGKQAHFRSVIEGYQASYADDYEAAFKLAQDSNDLALQCVHYPRHLYYLIIRSQYQEAKDLALTARQLALDSGDAVNYLSCEFFHAWALFYLGEWKEMQAVMDKAATMATRNAHTPWILHFQLQRAWLLLNKGEYSSARDLCQPIYEQARQGPPNSLYFFSLVMLIRLETACRQKQLSQQYVTEVLVVLEEKPLAIDWVLRFPLQQGLTEYYLQQEKRDEAYAAALELQKLAACSGEKTYQLMAETFLEHCAEL